MQIQGIPITSTTSFSKLISDYLSDSEGLKAFHNGIPSLERLIDQSDNREFSSDKREVLSLALKSQYDGFSDAEGVLMNIEALKNESAYTVTTGHQLCLYAGPMFSILKIISVINICHQLSKNDPSKTFVPVFWMASEDHDLEEINHVFLRGEKMSWNTGELGAVGRMSTNGMNDLIDELKSGFSEDFLAKVETLINVYHSDNIAIASRNFLHQLFGKHGLVIIDGDDSQLKKLFVPTILKEVQHSLAFEQVISQNRCLEKLGYKTQVNAPQTFLFKLLDGSRIRLDRVEDSFLLADGSQKWSSDELLADIEANPHSWSPNVVGRALYQEVVLPNLGYVGGPSELAYWLQLNSLFDAAGVQFPSLILRNSATFMFPGIVKKMNSLKMDFQEVFKSEDVLVSSQVQDQVPSLDVERRDLLRLYDNLAMKLVGLDNGLVKSTDAEKTKALKGLENLESKSIRAAKRKNEELIGKVKSILKSIRPNGIPQERQLNILEVMSVFGVEIIDDLIPVLDPFEENMWIVTL